MVVQYSTGMQDPKPNFNAIVRQNKLFETLPVKICAYHIVLDSRKQNSLAFQVIKISSRAANVRTIFHFGHHTEVQYDLRRFGINTDNFPISLNGDINLKRHHQYLNELRMEELSQDDTEIGNKRAVSPVISGSNARSYSAQASTETGIEPTPNDVIFGRGFNAQYHPGMWLVCETLTLLSIVS